MTSICIVGHGKSIEGKGWGTKIDSTDFVIRMWDWHWCTKSDYGEKYDYGVLEDLPGILMKFRDYNQRQPSRGFVVSNLHRGGVNVPLPDRSTVISQIPWTDLGKEMGGLGASGNLHFTRGVVAACWAIEGADAGDQLILVGFDNVYAGNALPVEEGFSSVYCAQPTTFSFSGYRPGRKYGNHDFGIERPVLERLATERGVTLHFSQELWQ